MFSYYGGKRLLAKHYPKPIFNKIIEPFCGAANYSLRHFDNDVLLIDKNPVIIEIWSYLKECSLSEILKLPHLKKGSILDIENFDCPAQYNLMRFLIAQASCGGVNKVSDWGEQRFKNNINFIKKNHFKIKHWNFKCLDFRQTPIIDKCTYFIDPPYFVGGHKYKMSNRKIDFNELGNWCKNLPGQVIVCENTKADWLPFVPMVKLTGLNHTTMESIWTNSPTHYNNLQQSLF